jgi:drug/metabolite transporter (DMT)-like permease
MKIPYIPLALSAILLWGFLAYLSTNLSHLPALLIVGITLSIGGLLGMLKVRSWWVPWRTFLTGVTGIFGYHFLLFTAFQHAPTLEANLLNYLWPLLIVVLSPLILTGYRLKIHHILGALSGLLGAGLIVSGGKLQPDAANLAGYLLPAAAALTWSVYSLLTKRLPPFSSAAVGSFCLTSGILALVIYLLETGPAGLGVIRSADWPYLLLLGAGPLGAAFFLWDAALKRGDPRVIGSLSYLTPLISTLALVLLGGRLLTPLSAAAMLLIVSGAVVGSLDVFQRAKKVI